MVWEKIAQGKMGASDSLKIDLKITPRKRNPFPNTEIFGKSILIEQTTGKGQVCIRLTKSHFWKDNSLGEKRAKKEDISALWKLNN